MKLTVTGRKMKITDAIREHMEKKIEQHIKPWAESGDVHLALAVEKHGHFSEVTVKTKGYTAHAEHETDDLYASIDASISKIEKQLKKHKDRAIRVKSKKNHERSEKESLGL